MFEFPVLDEATLEAVRAIEAERAVYQRKEALQLYYTLSRDFRDAFSELGIFVLKPVCMSCANQRSFGWSSNKSTMIRELYGHACYACGATEKITVDHIMPKNVEGQAIPTNLQLLCEKCNGEKADTVPKRLILALDFLMRPAPWDSYEGLIW